MKLDKFSYSKLSTFTSCPMKYKLKYVDGNYESNDAIHLDLGNLLHKILEIKYRNIIEGKEVDYGYLKSILIDGVKDETEKDKNKFLIGIPAIQEKFGEELYYKIDSKSGLSYEDKMKTFLSYLENDDLGDWKPLAVELPFEIVYKDKIILHGFIDRVDENSKGDIRVVDYKSSNKLFSDKDLPTPLQMFVYALACEQIYGKVPTEYIYDMVLLGEKQYACSNGFYNRGIKKLDKIVDSIYASVKNDNFVPKPSPLCHWCDFCKTNPNTSFYVEDLCEYYSLWTPENKTFQVNKSYEIELDF